VYKGQYMSDLKNNPCASKERRVPHKMHTHTREVTKRLQAHSCCMLKLKMGSAALSVTETRSHTETSFSESFPLTNTPFVSASLDEIFLSFLSGHN